MDNVAEYTLTPRELHLLIDAAQRALDMAERAHGGNPYEGEEYYALRDSIRARIARWVPIDSPRSA